MVILTTILLIIIQCRILLTRVTQQSLPHICVSTSLWVSRPLHGSWKSHTHSPLPNEFFPLLVHHPLASTCQLHTSFIHGNLTLHHCLAPLVVILLCCAFFQDSLCGLLWALLCVVYCLYSNYEIDLSLLHLQKGSKYTPYSCSNFKRNLDNLATSFASHHHWLYYHLLGR